MPRGTVRIASPFIAALGALTGCSKGLVGDYSGTLRETFSVVRISDEKAGAEDQTTANLASREGGAATDGYALHVGNGPAKDKLEVTVQNCRVVFSVNESIAT